MLRIRSVFCLLLVLLVSTSAFAVDFKTKPKLAFFPLVAKNVETIAFTEGISTQLFNNIERTDFFEILERKKVETALVQDGQALTSLSKEALYDIGNKAGFDLFVIGEVSRAENATLINLQVIGSGSHIAYYTETFRVPEFEIPRLLQEITDKIVAKVKEFNLAPPPVVNTVASPTNLSVSGTPKSIKLKWTPPVSNQVIGYAILRSNSADGSFVQIASSPKPSYTDANLKLNETFYYKVKAIARGSLDCALSEAVVGKTTLAPRPPIFMEIKPELAGSVLTWLDRPYSGGDPSLVTSGFNIYRKAQGESDYRLLGNVDSRVVSYQDTAMERGVVYSYRLTSYNADNAESEFSSSMDSSCAEASGNLQAASGGMRRVQLTWTPSANRALKGFTIYRSRSESGEFARIGQVRGDSAGSYLDSPLEDDSTYWYRITANLEGNQETFPSPAVSATTHKRPPTPTGLAATGNLARKVSLTWRPVEAAEEQIRAYRVSRSGKADGEFARIADVPADRNGYLDARAEENHPLADGTTYYYRLSAINEVGSESLPTTAVSATTREMLTAPKNLTASVGQVRKVTLAWDKSPEAGIKEYVIYRGPAGQKEVLKHKSVQENSFIDSSLHDGTGYVYAVRSVDGDEIESPLSFPATGTTKPQPAAPKGAVLTEQGGKTVFGWQPSVEKDVVRYNVYKKNFVGMFLKEATVEKNLFPLGDLKGMLELRVTAEDADGLESEKSEMVRIEVK